MIRGFFDERSGPQPFVRVGVRLPDRQAAVLLPFLVDTGATVTCINPLVAALQLGISRNALTGSPSETIAGVGGAARVFRVTCEFSFPDDGKAYVFELGVHVPELTVPSGQLPSVLGWDLLSAFKVCVDRLEGSVTLEAHAL